MGIQRSLVMAATVRHGRAPVVCRAADLGSAAWPIARDPGAALGSASCGDCESTRGPSTPSLAALITLLLVWEVVNSDVEGPLIGLVAASLAIGLPLAWRREAPLVVAAVVGAASVVQRMLAEEQEPQTPLLALLLAAFSAGAYDQGRAAVAGLVCCIAAVGATEADDLVVMGPVLVGTWFAGRVVQARERDAQRLRELSEALERERVEEARIAAADERARIARELHDVIAHAMSTIVLEAGAERVNLPPGQASTGDALRSIERTGRQALTEMRRLVGVLRSGDENTLVGAAAEPCERRGARRARAARGPRRRAARDRRARGPAARPGRERLSHRAGGAHERAQARGSRRTPPSS